MNIDHLSRLPVDVFIKEITYLPFDDVISVCKSNTTLHNYCTNSSYNNKWRQLIDNTFSSIHNYQEKLDQVRNKLNLNDGTYNYLVYSYLVRLLDPITQLMIYYKQGDIKSFDDPQYNNTQKFLALFLLCERDKIMNYLPAQKYVPFINMIDGDKIDQNILNWMLIEMARKGSVKGVSMMLSKGADIHAGDDGALRWASQNGHLEVVKYLIEHGAVIHADDDYALALASEKGHLDVVRYLIEHEANVHAEDDEPLRVASYEGHVEVVKYLVEQGADIHADDDWALRGASQKGHLEVVKYLESLNN